MHAETVNLDNFSANRRSKSSELVIQRCKRGTWTSPPIASILQKPKLHDERGMDAQKGMRIGILYKTQDPTKGDTVR